MWTTDRPRKPPGWLLGESGEHLPGMASRLFKIECHSSGQSTGCLARVSGFTVSTVQVPETWRGRDHLRHTHVVPSPRTSSGCSARVSGLTTHPRGRDHLRLAPTGRSVLTFYFKSFWSYLSPHPPRMSQARGSGISRPKRPKPLTESPDREFGLILGPRGRVAPLFP